MRKPTGLDAVAIRFSRASLRGAVLRNANLRGANLSGADLRGVDMTGADVVGAEMEGALCDEYTRFPKGFGYWDFHARRVN